jgi:hypothetical protein
MEELEKEIIRLQEIIRQKDDRINDLLDRLQNLSLAYQTVVLEKNNK